MSGLLGLLDLRGGPARSEQLRLMLNATYGPESEVIDTYCEGPAGLGGRAIAPLVDPESGLAIVADVRLDNRSTLIAALGETSRTSVPESDSTLVMRAYRKWGRDCVKRLEGDFSFVIRDAAGGGLFCARDPMGARPLMYTKNDRCFACASDPDVLVIATGPHWEPNPERIASLFEPHRFHHGGWRNWQNGAYALRPGEWLFVEPGGRLLQERYFRLEAAYVRRSSPDAEHMERFQDLFGQAVARRTAGSAGPAVMLSGGLDSAAVLAMMRRQAESEQGIETYSIMAGDDREGPENSAINALASLPGVRPHSYRIPGFGEVLSRSDLAHIAWERAHPSDNSILLPNLLYVAAARNGHRAMLHGANGDVALFSPTYYMAGRIARLRWLDAWRECQLASTRHVSLRGRMPANIFLRAAAQSFPEELKRMVRRFRAQPRPEQASETLLDAQFAQRVADIQADRGSTNDSDTLAEETAEMVAFGLSGFNRNAARFGVEVADPWGDRDLVAFCLGLPLDVRAKEGRNKYLARHAFANDLPTEVTRRSDKQHFGGRLVELLMHDSREFVASVLDEDIGLVEPFVTPAKVHAVRSRYFDSGDSDSAQTLLRLVSLILWIKRVNFYTSASAN